MEKNIKAMNNALTLIKEMHTVWDNYDFLEISKEPEKRVPKMIFDAEAKVTSDKVRSVLNFHKEAFIREVHVTYRDVLYVVILSADTQAGHLVGMHIEVYTPNGKGMGELSRLIIADL